MACSSPLRYAFAIRLISITTSSRSEYYCSSFGRLDLHLLPHLLSSALMEGWPPNPTVYSRQSASTVLTERHMLWRGGSWGSCCCSCCSAGDGLGQRSCGARLARAEA